MCPTCTALRAALLWQIAEHSCCADEPQTVAALALVCPHTVQQHGFNSTTDPVLEIVRGIYRDPTGRSGLGLDDETKAEMVAKWYGIVNRHFGQTTLLGPMDILEAVESGRCICVGTDVWCTHEGRCKRP